MKIIATGMVSPVGFFGQASCAALRAGISAFRELPYWDCEHFPVVGAQVPGLDGVHFGPRMVKLLSRAIRECIARAPLSAWQGVPLLISLPEPNRPGSGDLRFDFVQSVVGDLGVEFHPYLSQTIKAGNAGGFEGIRIGREMLQDSAIPGVIVSGVDSFICGSTIFWLDQNYRLKRPNHMDGVVPGEGAAAVLLHRSESPSSAVAQITGLGFCRETATLLSGEALLGHGLANAAKAALNEAGWKFHEVDFRVSDVTGETYGFQEHTLAEARLVTAVRIEPQPIWHAADCIGETGAAAGLIQLAWVSDAFQRGYAPGPRALCFTSSLPGERAVAAVYQMG